MPAAASTRLYTTKNDLPEATRREGVALLNQRLDDCIDLQAQSKQAHWNVKGPSFIALHKLFDDIHASVTEYSDLLAERGARGRGARDGAGSGGAIGARRVPDDDLHRRGPRQEPERRPGRVRIGH